jgi:quercetin dioxygenase-like cupin family protein
MALEVRKAFFSDRVDVMRDLGATGFWPTTFVSLESAELPVHWHDVEVHTYVMEGETYIVDGETGERHSVEAGDKIVIPTGVLHAEGVVESRVVYIVALPEASNLEPLYRMLDPSERA